jgi:hypothetical protein
MAGELFTNPSAQSIFTMYALYNRTLIEDLSVKLTGVKHLILFLGTNDILRDGEEPLESVAKNYFDYLTVLKEKLNLEVLVTVLPPPISKNIEWHRSVFNLSLLSKRLGFIEEEASRRTDSYIKIIRSQVVAGLGGFVEDIYSHADGVHLNRDGYRLLALEIIESIKEIDNG